MYSVQVKTKQQLNLSERLNFVMKVLMMHHLLMSYGMSLNTKSVFIMRRQL